MAGGWTPTGPDQPLGGQGAQPNQPAPQGNAIENGWAAQGPDTPMEPTEVHPVAKASIEDTRSIFQKTHDVLFGHEPEDKPYPTKKAPADPALEGEPPDNGQDTDRTYRPGIFPAIQASSKDQQSKIADFATAGPSWGALASAYPHIMKAQGDRIVGATQEAGGAYQTNSAEVQLAALNVLPQAAARLNPNGQNGGFIPPDVLAKDPLVKKEAIKQGLDPVVFAGMWSRYAGMTNEQRADAMADAQQTYAKGVENKNAGANSRFQAWADEKAWEPHDLLNGKVDPASLKGIAFNTATALPGVVASVGATVAGTAVGGPGVGMAAGGATMAAIFAPQAYSSAKDTIDTQVDRLLQKADEVDKSATPGNQRALNPVSTQLRQQAHDLAASSDNIAATSAVLNGVAAVAGNAPVSAVLSRAPGAQALINNLLGQAAAKTVLGRAGATAVANGGGAVLQAAIQKGIDAGIVHETQPLSDALKDIAYAGLIGVTTSLPIAGYHAMAGAHADAQQAQAKRDFDSDQFQDFIKAKAANYDPEGPAPLNPRDPFPGYRWDPNAPRPGASATGGDTRGQWVPTGDAAPSGTGTGATPKALPAPEAASGATNGAAPAPEGPAGNPKAQTYQEKIDGLNQAAAAAEKRSDVTLQPAEEGWEIHVKGEPVASFDTAENARAALAQARKLVGTAPKDQDTSTEANPSAKPQAPADQQETTPPNAETKPANPETNTPKRDFDQQDLERTQEVDVVPPDRRTDTDLRSHFDAMSPDQKFAAVYAHELTGIPNRRAYAESAKLPGQASIDLDSLKWFNDNVGHDAGDALLKASATAFNQAANQHGGQAFHISGDEFHVQGKSPEHVEQIMQAAKARLDDATLTFQHPDGRTVTLNGIGFSHGTGQSLHEAEGNLATAKAGREQTGDRAARGQQPPNASLGTGQTRLPAEESGLTAGGGLSARGKSRTEVLGQRVQSPAVPTEAQRATGNYFKPTVKWRGLPIKIENEPGSTRPFVHPDGTAGKRTMLNHYGYFPGREGADGDGVDVFMGPAKRADTGKAYVIDQLTGDGKAFDEHKVVLSVRSAAEAKKLYLDHYQADWQGFGAITAMDGAELKTWLQKGDLKSPVKWSGPTVERKAGPDERHDSILQYLARHERGIDSAEAERQGIDKADMKLEAAHVGIRRAFRKDGMTFDEAAEHLHESGYPVTDEEGNYSPNVLADRLSDELAGKPHYSVQNESHTEDLARAQAEKYADPQATVTHAELERATPEQFATRWDAIEAEQERLAIQAEAGQMGGATDDKSRALDPSDPDYIPFAKKPMSQADLFGAKDHVKNELKKLEAELDRRRNSGQTSLETGDPSDLFSQARHQVDLTDINKLGEPTQFELEESKSPTRRMPSNQLDIFAQPAPKAAAKPQVEPIPEPAAPPAPRTGSPRQAALQLAARSKLVTVGTFRTGHERVGSWPEAAHLLAPLRKGSQESLAFLVIDKDDKPLAVIRASLGTVNSTGIEYGPISGAIASIPGAKRVFMAHNHPSGELSQSQADNKTMHEMGVLLHAMGIESPGSIVFGPNSKAVSYVPWRGYYTRDEAGNRGNVNPAGKTKALVPYMERRVGAVNRAGMAGASGAIGKYLSKDPRGVGEVVAEAAKTIPAGILLANNQRYVIGILPMDAKQMAILRYDSGSAGAQAILRAIHESNANYMTPYGSDSKAVLNVVRFGTAANMNVMYGFEKIAAGWKPVSGTGGSIFKRLGATGESGGMSVGEVKRAASQVTANFRTKVPVVVVKSAADLEKIPGLEGRTDPDAIGMYDPKTDKVYLVADEMHSPDHVGRLIAHEMVTHFGLRAMFGNNRQAEYSAILRGVEQALPGETRKRLSQYFPDTSWEEATPGQRDAAAEEALAFASEQHFDGKDMGKPMRGLLERLYTMIRDWLRNAIGMAPKFDEYFVRRTLDDLATFLRKGAGRAGNLSTDPAGAHPASAKPQDTFYSAVARAVDAAKREKGTGAEWEATLKNMPGVKGEEMEWLGLKDWLAGQSRVTKARVAAYVDAHRIELGERNYGDYGRDHEAERLTEKIRDLGFELEEGVHPGSVELGSVSLYPDETEEGYATRREQASNLLEQLTATPSFDSQPQYKEYATPGGANYREKLLTLPKSSAARAYEQTHERLRANDARARADTRDAVRDVMESVGDSRVTQKQLDRANLPHWLSEAAQPESELYESARSNIARVVEWNKSPGFPDGARDLMDKAISAYTVQFAAHKDLLAHLNPTGAAPDGWGATDNMRRQNGVTFRSGHWDAPNVLAHIRYDDRVGPNGERVLHIHEIQSDWHQAGRKQGYASVPTPEERAHLERKLAELDAESTRLMKAGLNDDANWHTVQVERNVIKEELAGRSGVPNAPFKTSWPELAFKRMLREAVSKGYDAISWDTGETNADRYNMQAEVDKIVVQHHPGENPDQYHLIASKGGHTVREENWIGEQRIAALVGKEIAQKAVQQTRSSGQFETSLTGNDLKIGGAGMRGFYNDILPKTVNKLVKRWGGSVQPSSVMGAEATGGTRSVVDAEGGVSFTSEDERIPAHYVAITPAMRDAVLGGLPLFRKKNKGQPMAPRPPGPMRKGYEVARKVAQLIPDNEFVMAFRRILDPANVSPEAKAVATVTRSNLGELAQAKAETLEKLETYAKAFDQLPIADRYDFIHAMEMGAPQPHAVLQPAADTIRGLLDGLREEVRDLGIGALDNWIENYFPHIWQDPDQAKKLFGQIFGRRPMKGPASFLKQRTIPTTKEGLALGLKPVSSNPLILAYAKAVEMQRFIAGTKLMQTYKDTGLARFFPAHKIIPDGWTKIEDAVGRVRQWSEAEQGFIERGFYAMPTDGARVINNHLGGSALRNFLPATIFKVASNMINALQLGFSGFHLGFTTMDAIVSKNALGIERLLHGEPVRAAKAFVEANGIVSGPIMNLVRGHKLLKAYTNIGGATPEMRELVQALIAGGGRTRMDRTYMAAQGVSPFKGTGFMSLAGEVKGAMTLPAGKVQALAKVVGGFPREYSTRLWTDLKAMAHEMRWPVLTVPLEIAGRVTRASTAIIMEHIVPLQKLGVFSDLASDWLRRNPEADPVAVSDAMQKIWASVDNRLGEMVYDNLFWNRTFKDVTHMMVRAVGWNLGTVRELGGAPVDTLKLLDYMMRAAPPEPVSPGVGKTSQARMDYEAQKSILTRIAEKAGHKIAYTLGLIATTMIANSVIQNLATGKGPQEMKDYFFPRTGRLTKYGTPERISPPTYTKDIYEYATNPIGTLINKANPIFGIIHAIYANEDFFGDPVRTPGSGFWHQLWQGAKYAWRESAPFSVQGTSQFANGGSTGDKPWGLTVAPSFGFGPAPARVTSPDQMERYQREEYNRAALRGLERDYKKAIAAHDTKKMDELRPQVLEAKRAVKQTGGEIKQDKARAREAAGKISQVIQGKSKRDAVAALHAAGMPAFAQLWSSMPDDPKPRVLGALAAFA